MVTADACDHISSAMVKSIVSSNELKITHRKIFTASYTGGWITKYLALGL